MKKKTTQLPRYGRAVNPPNMRLTERDRHILEAIHAYDGMLSFSQIRRLFFSGKSQAEVRLMLLYQHKYLNRPERRQRLRLPEMIYWLDRRGAELVSSWSGMNLSQLGWRREPRWFQVEHDIAVNNFRLDLEAACKATNDVYLESWVPESEFWAYPDRVKYTYQDRKLERSIRPDGFFILVAQNLILRYLLEIDRSTEDNPRFLREKILPGMAYLRSKEYVERFGFQSGRWLVITTGDRRMENMLSQAEKVGAKGSFYFTTFDRVNEKTILREPIWYRADKFDPVPLFFD
jgi:hypothetical protein